MIYHMKVLSLLSAWILLSSVVFSQVPPRGLQQAPKQPDLIPIPQITEMGAGYYDVAEPVYLANYLTKQWFAGEYQTEKVAPNEIRTELLTEYDTLLGTEGYHLLINSSGILIRANGATGLFYGHQTLRQIVMQTTDQENTPFRLPYLSITDYPSFRWRGMLLDCCRHFMEKDFILRYIDLLAFYKMNVFHWHLTEDQGWRIEIEKYPLLTEIGAWRTEADGSIYGGFYTKEEIREVVAYAAARNITVVPEIEMPGHAMAALAAYPSLSCTGGPFEVPTTWGVFKDIYCVGNDSVFVFLKDVLDEVLELFPSEYIHIGGDEAPKYHWEHCAKCKKRLADHNLKDAHSLQSWFIGEIAVYLKSRGRKLIGWDEIIEGGLVKGVTVQSWQSFEGARHAAETGNDAVVSPTSHAYFDYPVHKLTLEKVYSFNPIPKDLPPALHKHIFGGECNMWTERAPQHLVDQKVFPRILAMAEVLWSDPPTIDSTLSVRDGWTKIESPQRDYLQFRQRVRQHYPILTALGVNYGLEEGGLKIATTHSSKGMMVTMIPEQDNITIRYCLGPDSLNHDKIYTHSMPVSEKLTIHAAAYIGEKRVSEVFTREYNIHRGTGFKYTLSQKPGGTYNKNPQTTLADGIRGTTDFHDGLWLGFWEKDVSISFSFNDPQTLNMVAIGFLQSNPSWIFLPGEVTLIITPKGFMKRKIRYQIKSNTPKETLTAKEDFRFNLEQPVRIRKLTIDVKNPGTCPEWHPGAGSPTWIFIDEVLIM
jgi:hexosaminidase